MDLSNFKALRVSSVFETFPNEMQDLLTRLMSTPEETMQEIIVEVHKSPRTPRPKKDK